MLYWNSRQGCPLPLVLGCQIQPHFPPHFFLKRKFCVWSISSRGLSFFLRRHLSRKSHLKQTQHIQALLWIPDDKLTCPILPGPKCTWIRRALYTQCSRLWPCLCAPRRKLRAYSGQRRYVTDLVYFKWAKLQRTNGIILGKWIISSSRPHKALYYFSG